MVGITFMVFITFMGDTGLSVQWSGLDIHDIPTPQIEKKRYQLWCKNGGKMVYYAFD